MTYAHKILLILSLVTLNAVQIHADGLFEHLQYYGRMGYSLGGTAPVGMPSTIRSLNRYTLKPNVQLALDAYKPLGGPWGLMAGFYIENKGMETDATVKNYHMEIRRGNETLEGVFTGKVVTDVEQWMLTLPLLGTFDLGRQVRLKLGPYFSYVASHKFNGYAYDGHLRQGDPTGIKVMLGTGDDERGTYDFADDMRRWQWGVDAGADWYFSHHWGAYANLSWGFTGVFRSGFDTVEQTLYPIYGTVGIIYQFK